MKAVIPAGGMGTRLKEITETSLVRSPSVVHHELYSHHGVNDFIAAVADGTG